MFHFCNIFYSEMMDQFVLDLTELWKEVGLELKPRAATDPDDAHDYSNEGMAKLGFCPQGGEACAYCQKPMLFEQLEARVRDNCTNMAMEKQDKAIMHLSAGCQKPNCPRLISAAA